MAASKEEKRPLLGEVPEWVPRPSQATHLSTLFAAACIIDQFGVIPIIALPRAIILCGWVGYPLAVFVFSLTIYTAMLLGRCWVIAEHLDSNMYLKRRYPYAALVENAWGKVISRIINIYINIGIFGSNIPALLLASQNLQFFDSSVSNNTFNFSYCYWLIILGAGLCPLTWLGSPKDSKWISVVSTLLVIVTASISWACMFMDAGSAKYADIPIPNWESVGITFGILAFQFGCHPAILTIQSDMHQKTDLSVSVLLSFLATASLSFHTVILAAVVYGSETYSNLIQGLPSSPLLYVGVMCVTLQLFLSSVVGGCSLFQDIEDKLGIPPEMCWQRCLVRSVIVMLAVLAAELLPSFDLVMGLLGGLFTGPITFIMPPLLYRKYRRLLAESRPKGSPVLQYYMESLEPGGEPQLLRRSTLSGDLVHFIKKHFFTLDVNLDEGDCTPLESTILTCILLVGLSAAGSATYFSVIGAIDSTHHTPPCFVDVIMASFVRNK